MTATLLSLPHMLRRQVMFAGMSKETGLSKLAVPELAALAEEPPARRRSSARRKGGLQSRPGRAKPHNTQTCGRGKVVGVVVVSAVVIIAIVIIIIIIIAIAWSPSCS